MREMKSKILLILVCVGFLASGLAKASDELPRKLIGNMGLYIPDHPQRCHSTLQARTMDFKTERRCDLGHARAKAKRGTGERDV